MKATSSLIAGLLISISGFLAVSPAFSQWIEPGKDHTLDAYVEYTNPFGRLGIFPIRFVFDSQFCIYLKRIKQPVLQW